MISSRKSEKIIRELQRQIGEIDAALLLVGFISFQITRCYLISLSLSDEYGNLMVWYAFVVTK
jgi:hypothetical protein